MKQIAFYMIMGKPLFAYVGMLALILFVVTASIPFWNRKREKKIPFQWHPRLAKVAIALGLLHALLAASLFF